MSHAQAQLLDRLPRALADPPPASVLLTSHRDNHCEDDLRQGAEFGRLDEQCPVADYASNDLIEVNSSEVTAICSSKEEQAELSTYNSGDDIAATPMDSEVDEAQKLWECWLHHCRHTGERERHVLTHPEFITLIEKIRRRAHHAFGQVREPAPEFSHKKKSSTKLHPIQGEFLEKITKFKSSLELPAHQAARGEQEALSRLSEAEFRSRILLEEQRSHILPEAKL